MLDRMNQESRDVVHQLMQHGYEAYFVGGCVRDAWLGHVIQDMDIATSATPEQVMACFPHTAPTGLQHGTVMVIGEHSTYEVTTFRIEANYDDFRRPSAVEFTRDIYLDLERRDFTMNAMAMNLQGEIMDPFAGQADLARGILRCVGVAEHRFREDALRMLRCVRFASTYRLDVEAGTWAALLEQAPLLRHVAMERVRAELQRMVAGAEPGRAVELLLASQLATHFKRPLRLPVEQWLAHGALLAQLSALEEQHQRWVLLMLLLAVPADVVRQALQALTFSRAEQRAIVDVVGFHFKLADDISTAHRPDSAEPPITDSANQQLARIWKLAAVQHGTRVAEDWLRIASLLGSSIAHTYWITSLDVHRTDSPALSSELGSSSSPALSSEFGLSGSPVLSSELDSHISPVPTALPNGQDTLTALLTYGQAWIDELPCSEISQFAITGLDLLQTMKQPAGPWVRVHLQSLFERVALGEIANEREAILQAAILQAAN